MSIRPDLISGVTTAVATKAFPVLIAELTKKVLSGASKPLFRTYEDIAANFEPHLRATFVKCTKIKTLLNRDAPVELLSQYINLKFESEHKGYDDYDVISAIRDQHRVVVTGTAGTGKTMFMKYLWLSLFTDSRGRIPVFIELRRLNDLSTENLDSYIYRSIVNTNSNVSEGAFERGIAKGLFAFLFDGFDEISLEKRDAIAQQITDLAANNPECIIVVSSRPDDRFSSWQTFSTFRVQPLNKDQVIELIGKINYDEKIKSKFLQRLKKDLYGKHRSFLSSPLLATMMLMTFDQFADIPEKIHLFYEQAFDTL